MMEADRFANIAAPWAEHGLLNLRKTFQTRLNEGFPIKILVEVIGNLADDISVRTVQSAGGSID